RWTVYPLGGITHRPAAERRKSTSTDQERPSYSLTLPRFFVASLGVRTQLQTKPLSHPIERPTVDAEDFRRLDFVPFGFLEDAHQMTLLHFLKGELDGLWS